MAASLTSLHQLEKNMMCKISQLYFNNVRNVNEIFPSNYVESLSTHSWYVFNINFVNKMATSQPSLFVYKKEEAHGACIAHLFSPPKLFEGICYTRDFILTNLNLLAPRILHDKYQCIPASGSREEDF